MKTIHTSKGFVNSNSENLSLSDNLSDLFNIQIAEIIPHFDKTELYLTAPLKSDIGRKLKHHCHSWNTGKLHKNRRFNNYRHFLNIVNPDSIALEIISHIPDILINQLEIAVDCFIQGYGKSDYIALTDCMHWPLFRKGQPANCQLAISYNPDFNSLTFGNKTVYIGKNPKFTGYARISKVNAKPCFHMEFRLSNSKTIAEKTGIESVKDLIQAIESESTGNIFKRILSENFTAALTDTAALSKKIFPKWNGKVDIASAYLHFAREAHNARVMESLKSASKEDRKAMQLIPLGIAGDLCILQKIQDRVKHSRGNKSAFQKSLKTVRAYNMVAQPHR